MAIHLIFSDIDGTLINSHHELTERTIRAVQGCTSRGIPFVLVSARMPSGISPLQRQLGLSCPIICYSGALIVDALLQSSAPLHSETMNAQTAFTVYQHVSDQFPSVSFSAYSFNRWLVSDLDDPWVVQEQAIAGTTAYPFAFRKTQVDDLPPIHKILCMGDPAEIDKLQLCLTDMSLDAVCYKSKPTYLEIMANQASKASAMQKIMDRFQIPQEQTLAFGDNFNDVPMLRFAGVGVAMANAPMQVKGSADYVTLSNDQDGIAAALERLGILPAVS
ncbi:Cof-type HAD-IIB family hydrolase [Sporolactobacillus inulinus]|uniref:Hydrolase n=2 Tax=Sporolactobacillus inulinus TaxID=2078 RepID=A0A0U1QNB8_9BACL|nr:Cof-type HAD-IIB family hydrolase [Sporolactobacillus inulinus]KLI02298.1 hypothetical protein SINU_08835 [Sporolactobacillus inulinus CASD]GEB75822.1 hypothetical protein SIN01_01670 [Sporolactobacillus inulinus]